LDLNSKKWKMRKKSLKILHDLLSLMVSFFFCKLHSFSIICGQYKLNQNEKRKKCGGPARPTSAQCLGGQNIPSWCSPHPWRFLPVPPRLSPATVRSPWLLSGRRCHATAPCPRFTAR
jgi:hypothetical protein